MVSEIDILSIVFLAVFVKRIHPPITRIYANLRTLNCFGPMVFPVLAVLERLADHSLFSPFNAATLYASANVG